ncbi:hypothetical protein JCM5350_000927 [Sporobolomyces pararoseus]
MSSEPQNSVSTSRTDYLSSLPGELLDSIFRDAYDQDRPTGPLSKHLLPYYEKNLYRYQIRVAHKLPRFRGNS